MDVAPAAQHGVAGENVRENVDVIRGGQGADDGAVRIDGDAVGKDPLLGDRALEQPGNRGAAVQSQRNSALGFRVELRQWGVRQRRLILRADDAPQIPAIKGHGQKVIALLGLPQLPRQAGPVLLIAGLFQEGRQGGQDLEARLQLLVDAGSVLLRLRSDLAADSGLLDIPEMGEQQSAAHQEDSGDGGDPKPGSPQLFL